MSTTIESRDRLIDILSLSYLGDLLREQLGDDAENYTWPDDFEKAVADIGFSGLVMRGDNEPYDLVVIGAGMQRTPRVSDTRNMIVHYRTATFIKSAIVPSYAFANQRNLTSVSLSDNCEHIASNAFLNCTSLSECDLTNTKVVRIGVSAFFGCSAIERIIFPNLPVSFDITSSNNDGTFRNCSALKTVAIPKISSIYGPISNRGVFANCVGLEEVLIGSVGFPVTDVGQYAFQGCVSSFSITVYTASQYVDSIVANIRNGATNATIVIKAAADMEYNGTTYQAGETVLTSTP